LKKKMTYTKAEKKIMSNSFIESQFPVSKISKESYKERKAGASQTLTGLGKWWGRKPLILVRATILGLLMPKSSDPEKDREIFLKVLTMDEEGLWFRKNKKLKTEEILNELTIREKEKYFDLLEESGEWMWKRHLSKEEIEEVEKIAFLRLNYDDQLSFCLRPEQVEGPSPKAWEDINEHLGTNATSLQGLVEELGQQEFGHTPRVGDAFAGGGSIPFEAARIGCDAYASDLNPAAALLTWASLNIIGGGEQVEKAIQKGLNEVFQAVDKQFTEWGIEHNEKGWRADAYLYCIEATSPATGYRVPLSPSWVISEKYKVCAVLKPDHQNKRYEFEVVTGADKETLRKAKEGTVRAGRLVCPETGNETPISTIRGDRKIDGEKISGLRLWNNEDIVPREDDIFLERLYCIRYIETFYTCAEEIIIGKRKFKKGECITEGDAGEGISFKMLQEEGKIKSNTRRHFVSPGEGDLKREALVLRLIKDRFHAWQTNGFIPSKKIIKGYNTAQPIRERGWTFWHHLYNPRQLLLIGALNKFTASLSDKHSKVFQLLRNAGLADYNSELCRWNPGMSKGPGSTEQTFYNMALNTHYNYGTRALLTSKGTLFSTLNIEKFEADNKVLTLDARNIEELNDFWITDPPYADAVNYHELGDYFLAWYEKQLPELFPDWYSESRAALAVKGTGTSFNQSMVECYSNFTRHMPDNGAQVVMFTHQDASVWADLALILWASGLQVTAAWTIQTETAATGIKKGNYVQGTVIMILRKQTSQEIGFLSDIQADVEYEVKEQLRFMTEVDNEDDPNFGDADYQLAAYAAALRVLTGYKSIEDINVTYELSREREKGEENEIQKIIESAVKVAMDYLVPGNFEEQYWRKLGAEERFYLKGLEVEKHGEYRSGVYQEMARGFGLREYTYILNSGKANMTRLKTPIEFKNKELSSEGFGKSITRNILFAIYETHKTEDPQMGRNWLHNELPGYWENRQLILHILIYIQLNTTPIEHWQKDITALELLKGFVENDSI